MIYALFESGSQQKFCTPTITDELNAIGLQQTIFISTLSSKAQPTSINTEAITFFVSGVDGDCGVNLIWFLAVDVIPSKAALMPASSELNSFKHLKKISLKEFSDKNSSL